MVSVSEILFFRLTPSRSFLATGNEGSQKKKILLPISPFPRRTGGGKGGKGKKKKKKKKKKKSSLVSSVAQKRERGRSVVLVRGGLANGFPEKIIA